MKGPVARGQCVYQSGDMLLGNRKMRVLKPAQEAVMQFAKCGIVLAAGGTWPWSQAIRFYSPRRSGHRN